LVAVAQATQAAPAPAYNIVALHQSAGVVTASRHGLDLIAAAQRGQLHSPEACGGLVVTDVVLVAVAQVTQAAPAPAYNIVALHQSAGVGATSRHGLDLIAAAQRGQLHSAHSSRSLVVADGMFVAVAQATTAARSPAHDVVALHQGAGVAVTSTDGLGAAQAAEVHEVVLAGPRGVLPGQLVITHIVSGAEA